MWRNCKCAVLLCSVAVQWAIIQSTRREQSELSDAGQEGSRSRSRGRARGDISWPVNFRVQKESKQYSKISRMCEKSVWLKTDRENKLCVSGMLSPRKIWFPSWGRVSISPKSVLIRPCKLPTWYGRVEYGLVASSYGPIRFPYGLVGSLYGLVAS